MKDFILTCLNLGLSDAEKAGRLLRKFEAKSYQKLCHKGIPLLCDFIDKNGVGSVIYLKIKEMGLLEDIPEVLKAHLRYAYQRNAARNFALEIELERCLMALNQKGIQAMLLKGAISFVKPIYPHAGLRFLSDIDLLVKGQEFAKAVAILEDLGYTADGDYMPSHHHHQSLTHQTGIGFIELHHCPVSLRYADWIDLESWWAEADAVTLGRASALVPSPEHQMLHLLLHNGMSHYGRLLSHIGRQLDFALNVEFYRNEDVKKFSRDLEPPET